MFFKFHFTSSHNKKEGLSKMEASFIYDFITHSITFVSMINKSYFKFLERAQKLEITGLTELAYYFSLDDCKDKELLQPVRIKFEDKERIIEIFATNKIFFEAKIQGALVHICIIR
jgi:hypothetical protein